MKRAQISLFFAMVVLMASLAAAASDEFTIAVHPVRSEIRPTGVALFDINITNTGLGSDTFRVSFDTLTWDTEVSPLIAYFRGVDLSPGESTIVQAALTPMGDLEAQQYIIKVYITALESGIQTEGVLVVTIRSSTSPFREYEATILVDVEITDDGKLDPRNPLVIRINTDNLNPLDIGEMMIRLDSNLIRAERTTMLGPLEKKTEEFRFDLDDALPPQSDTLTVSVLHQDETLKVVKSNLEITAYSNLDKAVVTKKTFLMREHTVTYTNHGNINRMETVKHQTSFFKKIFSSSDPASQVVKEDGKSYHSWKISLKPQESFQVTIVENYRYLALVVLISAMLIVLYYALRSPVAIKKEATIISTLEGGISQLKVLLYIKNRTKRGIKDVRVVDKVPNIAEFEDDVVLGTLKPVKVLKHEKKGTLIEWELPILEGFEERIISYKLRSKLSILGFFNLPPALVKYRGGKKGLTVVQSNRLKAAMQKQTKGEDDEYVV